jgi:hypothetical protein
MPTWVKVAVDAWTEAAGVAEGHVLRRIARGDQVRPERMSEKVVCSYFALRRVGGSPGIATHDLRRSCAKMCRAAGGELEQIQILLGHASVQTTERYLGTKQDLVHAPNDGIRFRVAVHDPGSDRIPPHLPRGQASLCGGYSPRTAGSVGIGPALARRGLELPAEEVARVSIHAPLAGGDLRCVSATRRTNRGRNWP